VLKFVRALFVWKINQKPILEAEETYIILGLNSVDVRETPYRLEFYDVFLVDYEIGPNVPHILFKVKHGDDTLGLIGDTSDPKSNLECPVVHGFAVARPECLPNFTAYLTQDDVHMTLGRPFS